MSGSSDGRLFHIVGPETEKARPPSFVLTVTADLVVDDLSQLLAESDSANVTRFRRYARQRWYNIIQ